MEFIIWASFLYSIHLIDTPVITLLSKIKARRLLNRVASSSISIQYSVIICNTQMPVMWLSCSGDLCKLCDMHLKADVHPLNGFLV